MARILFVWEQGSNLGHLSHLRLPMELAVHSGHDVYLAARELHRAPQVLGGLPITFLQAPFKQNVAVADHSAFLGYTHLIARQCFSSAQELDMFTRAWRGLFDLVQPELVVFEHSPTALIASRGYAFKKVLVGNGFTVPPVGGQAVFDPFLPFVTTARTESVMEGLRADDAQLLAVVNAVLLHLQSSPFARLSDIYTQADAQWLMSWPQLDHFGARPGQRYLGIAPLLQCAEPQWPEGPGPKVFGYLQNMPSMERLLQNLQQEQVCALLYARDLPHRLKADYTGAHIRFADELVDLAQVAAQASWVINHANVSTVAAFMLAGIPQLVIPRHQEQLFVSLRMVQHGGAVMAFQDQPGYADEIAALLRNPMLLRKAQWLQASCAATVMSDPSEAIRQDFMKLLA